MPGGGAGAGQMFGTVVGVAQYLGAAQEANNLKNEAKKLEANRPKLKRDALADENLNFLKSELSTGLSPQAEKAYTDANDKTFSSALSGVLRGGGDLNSVGDIYGKGLEGTQKLEMMRDNLRLNKIKNVLDESKYVDERNVISPFQVNEFNPWADKAQANALARAQAAKEKNDALNSIVGSVGGAAGGSGMGGGGGNTGGGTGSMAGSAIGGAGMALSDKRLKHNYYIIGKSPSGINIYEFSYLGSNDRYIGVLAHEVPQASFIADGYLNVDYSKIDVQFKKVS